MDTIVVTAPNPATDLPSYGGGFFPSAPHSQQDAGTIFAQSGMGYYQTAGFCYDTLAFLEKFIKEHGAKDPLTLQVVANNLRYACHADRNLVLHPGLNVYFAYHTSKPAPNKYDYRSMNIKQMSGESVTPLVAFAHYLWGEGQERSVSIAKLGLKISPSEIPAIMNIVNSGVVGTFPIASDFARDTFKDSVITGGYLGNITMRTEGTLTISAGGNWSYNGVGRAYNDKFDFNPSTHRGVIAESLTRLGGIYSGKAYEISIPGQIAIKGSGKR